VCTYVDPFPQYLAQQSILRYATQKLLICPPHLLNVAALPWVGKITTFEHFIHDNVRTSSIARWKARGRLPIRDN